MVRGACILALFCALVTATAAAFGDGTTIRTGRLG